MDCCAELLRAVAVSAAGGLAALTEIKKLASTNLARPVG